MSESDDDEPQMRKERKRVASEREYSVKLSYCRLLLIRDDHWEICFLCCGECERIFLGEHVFAVKLLALAGLGIAVGCEYTVYTNHLSAPLLSVSAYATFPLDVYGCTHVSMTYRKHE